MFLLVTAVAVIIALITSNLELVHLAFLEPVRSPWVATTAIFVSASGVSVAQYLIATYQAYFAPLITSAGESWLRMLFRPKHVGRKPYLPVQGITLAPRDPTKGFNERWMRAHFATASAGAFIIGSALAPGIFHDDRPVSASRSVTIASVSTPLAHFHDGPMITAIDPTASHVIGLTLMPATAFGMGVLGAPCIALPRCAGGYAWLQTDEAQLRWQPVACRSIANWRTATASAGGSPTCLIEYYGN